MDSKGNPDAGTTTLTCIITRLLQSIRRFDDWQILRTRSHVTTYPSPPTTLQDTNHQNRPQHHPNLTNYDQTWLTLPLQSPSYITSKTRPPSQLTTPQKSASTNKVHTHDARLMKTCYYLLAGTDQESLHLSFQATATVYNCTMAAFSPAYHYLPSTLHGHDRQPRNVPSPTHCLHKHDRL